MKKTLLLLLSAAFVSACGTDDTGFGGGNFTQFLVAGQLDQAGVTYIDDVGSIQFEQESQVGDSTFFQANLDYDDNNSVDLRFTLVKWSDIQVLTLRGRNGIEIPFSNSEFEILEAETTFQGIRLIREGTAINSTIVGYTTNEDGFLSYTRGNSVGISTDELLWSDITYLPFQNVSGSIEGWVGIRISSNTGVEIDGITIDVIAYKTVN